LLLIAFHFSTGWLGLNQKAGIEKCPHSSESAADRGATADDQGVLRLAAVQCKHNSVDISGVHYSLVEAGRAAQLHPAGKTNNE